MRLAPLFIGAMAAAAAAFVAKHVGTGRSSLGSAPLWIGASRFRSGRREPPTLIVLHSTETDIERGAARKIGNWWAGKTSPATSSHYVVDADEVVQCVREDDESWCAGTQGNRRGIHIELVGRSWKTNWLGDGRPVLERTAALAKQIAIRWGIPVVRVDIAGLKAGNAGFTTHAALTAAFSESDHTDPGGPSDERWPWAEFLEMVRES